MVIVIHIPGVVGDIFLLLLLISCQNSKTSPRTVDFVTSIGSAYQQQLGLEAAVEVTPTSPSFLVILGSQLDSKFIDKP